MKYLSSAAVGAGISGAIVVAGKINVGSSYGEGAALTGMPYAMAFLLSPVISGVALGVLRGWRDGLAGAAGSGAVVVAGMLYNKTRPATAPQASITQEDYSKSVAVTKPIAIR